MSEKNISNGILRALAIVIGIGLFMFFLYKIQSVIVYIIIAGILSLITRPFILFLRKRLRFPNSLSVITIMFFMLALLSGLIGMFIPLIALNACLTSEAKPFKRIPGECAFTVP